MKQNSTASETLTKQDLIDAFKEFRRVLDSRFDQIDNRFRDLEMRFDVKLDELELRIEDRARERHSEMLSKFDE